MLLPTNLRQIFSEIVLHFQVSVKKIDNNFKNNIKLHALTFLFLEYTLTILNMSLTIEIHPVDPQPHRYCMLASTASAPGVTCRSLGLYWSRDLCTAG